MNEMIERVASAIAAAEATIMLGADRTQMAADPRALARAAIEAMREPTEDMIERGIWSRSESGRYGPREMATTIYGAMINAALARS